jgi:hypothetical protein
MRREQSRHLSRSERESSAAMERIAAQTREMQQKIASQYKLEKQILYVSKIIYENNLWAIKMQSEIYTEMQSILLDTQWYCLHHWEKDQEYTLDQLDILSADGASVLVGGMEPRSS